MALTFEGKYARALGINCFGDSVMNELGQLWFGLVVKYKVE